MNLEEFNRKYRKKEESPSEGVGGLNLHGTPVSEANTDSAFKEII